MELTPRQQLVRDISTKKGIYAAAAKDRPFSDKEAGEFIKECFEAYTDNDEMAIRMWGEDIVERIKSMIDFETIEQAVHFNRKSVFNRPIPKGWNKHEFDVAKKANDIGYCLMKVAIDDSYILYDTPHGYGTKTSRGELITTRDIEDIEKYIDITNKPIL